MASLKIMENMNNLAQCEATLAKFNAECSSELVAMTNTATQIPKEITNCRKNASCTTEQTSALFEMVCPTLKKLGDCLKPAISCIKQSMGDQSLNSMTGLFIDCDAFISGRAVGTATETSDDGIATVSEPSYKTTASIKPEQTSTVEGILPEQTGIGDPYGPTPPTGSVPPVGGPLPTGEPPLGGPLPTGEPPLGWHLPTGEPPLGWPLPTGEPPLGWPLPTGGVPPVGGPLPTGEPPVGGPLPTGEPPLGGPLQTGGVPPVGGPPGGEPPAPSPFETGFNDNETSTAISDDFVDSAASVQGSIVSLWAFAFLM